MFEFGSFRHELYGHNVRWQHLSKMLDRLLWPTKKVLANINPTSCMSAASFKLIEHDNRRYQWVYFCPMLPYLRNTKQTRFPVWLWIPFRVELSRIHFVLPLVFRFLRNPMQAWLRGKAKSDGADSIKHRKAYEGTYFNHLFQYLRLKEARHEAKWQKWWQPMIYAWKENFNVEI